MTRPLEDRPDLVRYVNGEPMISRKGLAYLCGVSDAEVQLEVMRQGNPSRFVPPADWLRRAQSERARLGTDNMAEALYLLARERESKLN